MGAGQVGGKREVIRGWGRREVGRRPWWGPGGRPRGRRDRPCRPAGARADTAPAADLEWEARSCRASGGTPAWGRGLVFGGGREGGQNRSVLDDSEVQRVLAIVAHPDDVDFSA